MVWNIDQPSNVMYFENIKEKISRKGENVTYNVGRKN